MPTSFDRDEVAQEPDEERRGILTAGERDDQLVEVVLELRALRESPQPDGRTHGQVDRLDTGVGRGDLEVTDAEAVALGA